MVVCFVVRVATHSPSQQAELRRREEAAGSMIFVTKDLHFARLFCQRVVGYHPRFWNFMSNNRPHWHDLHESEKTDLYSMVPPIDTLTVYKGDPNVAAVAIAEVPAFLSGLTVQTRLLAREAGP
jgi:hypothetical protein